MSVPAPPGDDREDDVPVAVSPPAAERGPASLENSQDGHDIPSPTAPLQVNRTPIPLPTLQRWRAQIEPKDPLPPDDPRYVDFDRKGLRGSSPPQTHLLAEAISLFGPAESSCHLFTGFPGTGKSTELARLSVALREATGVDSTVIVVDAEQYIDRYTPPSIMDVLRVLAWHLDREASAAEGKDPDTAPGYLQRLWVWLQSDVQIAKIGVAAYGANLMAEIRTNPTFRDRVEQVLRLRFQEFAREAHQVIANAIHRIRVAMGQDRVVVVVDGLEKFSPLRAEERGALQEAIEATFCSHVEWLRIDAHVVYTFPLWLRFRRPDLGSLFDGPPAVLPMVKIVEPDGSPSESGIASMVEMLARRIDDMQAAFGPSPADTLRPILIASGGYPRQVLRLVRDALFRRIFPLTPEVVESVVAQLAEEYRLAMKLSDADLLRHVAEHNDLPSGGEAIDAIGRMFELVQVLTYRNGTEWYALHPLVARALEAREPGV